MSCKESPVSPVILGDLLHTQTHQNSDISEWIDVLAWRSDSKRQGARKILLNKAIIHHCFLKIKKIRELFYQQAMPEKVVRIFIIKEASEVLKT